MAAFEERNVKDSPAPARGRNNNVYPCSYSVSFPLGFASITRHSRATGLCRLELPIDGLSDGGEKKLVTELNEQAIALQQLLHWVLHLREAQLDAGVLQPSAEHGEHVRWQLHLRVLAHASRGARCGGQGSETCQRIVQQKLPRIIGRDSFPIEPPAGPSGARSTRAAD